jgi:hypothetical protein
MTDVLQDSITAIEKRIRELRPHLDEHERLQRALQALRATAAHTSGRRRAPAPRRAAGARRGARLRKRQPTRKQQFAALVENEPGITVAQAAKQLKMPKPNGLYVVARELTKSRSVRKQGAGYYPAPNSRGATAKRAANKSAARRRRTPAKTKAAK